MQLYKDGGAYSLIIVRDGTMDGMDRIVFIRRTLCVLFYLGLSIIHICFDSSSVSEIGACHSTARPGRYVKTPTLVIRAA